MNRNIEKILSFIYVKIDNMLHGELTYEKLKHIEHDLFTKRAECNSLIHERQKIQDNYFLFAKKTFAAFAANNMTLQNAERIYDLFQPLDRDGYFIFRTACKTLGIDFYREFITEDTMGKFEAMSGHSMLEYAETLVFGSFDYKIVGMYEIISAMHLDKNKAEYKQYRQKLYFDTVNDLVNCSSLLCCTDDEIISAQKNINNYEMFESNNPVFKGEEDYFYDNEYFTEDEDSEEWEFEA